MDFYLQAFLVNIFTFSGVFAGINDLELVPVYTMPSTDKLFTGISYQLSQVDDPSLNLVWNEDASTFHFASGISPLEAGSLFYFVPAWNAYHLRNGATNVGNVVFRCASSECYISLHTLPDPQATFSVDLYSPMPIGTRDAQNFHLLDRRLVGFNITNNLLTGGDTRPGDEFAFSCVINLESEIIGVNTTSPPVDVANAYIHAEEKLWVETILNPTPISIEKTFKEVVQVTDKTKITSDWTWSTIEQHVVETTVEAPAVPKTTTKTTNTIPNGSAVKFSGDIRDNETVRSIDILEKISVPPQTCVEIYLTMEGGTMKEQNITAHLRVSGKVYRFGVHQGEIRQSNWAPGLVLEQVMRYQGFTGKYIETNQMDVIYEIPGLLKSEQGGMKSSLVAHEIACPKTNKKN